MPRAPKWFPAWRYLWVRASIRGTAILIAAIIGEVVKHLTGSEMWRDVTLCFSVLIFYGAWCLFWDYMESRQ